MRKAQFGILLSGMLSTLAICFTSPEYIFMFLFVGLVTIPYVYVCGLIFLAVYEAFGWRSYIAYLSGCILLCVGFYVFGNASSLMPFAIISCIVSIHTFWFYVVAPHERAEKK